MRLQSSLLKTILLVLVGLGAPRSATALSCIPLPDIVAKMDVIVRGKITAGTGADPSQLPEAKATVPAAEQPMKQPPASTWLAGAGVAALGLASWLIWRSRRRAGRAARY